MFCFKNCTPSQVACSLTILLEKSGSRGENWGGLKEAALSRRDITRWSEFGEGNVKSSQIWEETEVKESLPLQRGIDRDRGYGTKSINR